MDKTGSKGKDLEIKLKVGNEKDKKEKEDINKEKRNLINKKENRNLINKEVKNINTTDNKNILDSKLKQDIKNKDIINPCDIKIIEKRKNHPNKSLINQEINNQKFKEDEKVQKIKIQNKDLNIQK